MILSRYLVAGFSYILLLLAAGCGFLDPRQNALETTAGSSSAGLATLIFTASNMRAGLNGYPIGVGILYLSVADDFHCNRPPRGHGGQARVSVHRPTVNLSIPADRPLVIDSSWSGADSICIVGNQGFMPRAGEVYRLTNSQNANSGACSLKLERLDKLRGRFVRDSKLSSLPDSCRVRSSSSRGNSGQVSVAGHDPYDYR